MACLRRIVAARELNPARSFQLAHIVDTYIHLDTEEEEKFLAMVTNAGHKVVKMMETVWDRALAERHKAGHEVGLQQGQEIGRKQGQEVGLVLGMRRVLLQLLETRFGELPRPAVRRVEECNNPEQLQRWSEGVLTAPDLRTLGLA